MASILWRWVWMSLITSENFVYSPTTTIVRNSDWNPLNRLKKWQVRLFCSAYPCCHIKCILLKGTLYCCCFVTFVGDQQLAAELEEVYGDIDAVDLYVGIFLEKAMNNSPFPITLIAQGAPYSIRGLLANPVSSPEFWKPSTFGGNVGFEIAKTASLEKLFCQNIKGKCPLVAFQVPIHLAREARESLTSKSHDEL